MATVNGKDF